jgi:hypothetical protein
MVVLFNTIFILVWEEIRKNVFLIKNGKYRPHLLKAIRLAPASEVAGGHTIPI